jgi:phage FluMu protein Com
MAPKHHPTPLSGGDRKALAKELTKARAMTKILAERGAEKRSAGKALIREADSLACQSWNERMWADGGPIDPSPTIDQAINGGYGWLEIKCPRCKTPRSVDLAALRHVATTVIADLASRLRCQKCAKAGKRPPAELHQLAPRQRHHSEEEE